MEINMVDFLLWMMASIGLTDILVNGRIAKPLRDSVKYNNFLNDMLTCSQCAGTWVGLFCAILSAGASVPLLGIFPKLILFACAGSFVSVLGRVVVDYFALAGTIPIDIDQNEDAQTG